MLLSSYGGQYAGSARRGARTQGLRRRPTRSSIPKRKQLCARRDGRAYHLRDKARKAHIGHARSPAGCGPCGLTIPQPGWVISYGLSRRFNQSALPPVAERTFASAKKGARGCWQACDCLSNCFSAVGFWKWPFTAGFACAAWPGQRFQAFLEDGLSFAKSHHSSVIASPTPQPIF